MTALAAIDCGTNSTRLLVVGENGDTLERLMRITRLGQGVDTTGRLADEAVGRTVSVLRHYREVMDRHGVERVRITATSAARDATNRLDFFSAATDAVGATPELLDGQEEGRLSFRGATAELDPDDGPFLVVDIGGGSTEFAFGSTAEAGGGPDGVLSTDIGCVRLTERFLHSDPPAPEELSQAFDIVRGHLDDVTREIPNVGEARRFVGLAGTVSAMAAVEMGLAVYDRTRIHHFVLTRAAAEDVFRTLATETRRQRLHNPGLEIERADVIVGGAVILVAIMRHFGLQECVVSESDILDGLVASLRG